MKPKPPLTEEQVARIAENRALIHSHAPEMLPMIKKMADLGMIEGWRNVDEVIVL